MFEPKTKKERIALAIATQAHKGQVDKGGHDYIEHPEFVADHLTDESERIVALLHDVVEDTDITIEYLSQYFDSTITDAIRCITHEKSIDYTNYLVRVKSNPIARQVKIQDIQNNMDLSRIPNPTSEDFLRLEKYKMALEFLQN